jgi:hypothetical protein
MESSTAASKGASMKTFRALRASLAFALLATVPLSAAFAVSNSVERDASIPFANHGGIRDWQADGDHGLWVQSVNRKWYYATFMGACYGLDFATSLGFDTRPMGAFDRWSTVLVPGRRRCAVRSFTPSDGPPSRHKAIAAPIAPAS